MGTSLRERIRQVQDSFGGWPSLKIEVQAAPWHWRIIPWWYRDDVRADGEGEYIVASWLMIEICLSTNKPLFTWEKP